MSSVEAPHFAWFSLDWPRRGPVFSDPSPGGGPIQEAIQSAAESQGGESELARLEQGVALLLERFRRVQEEVVSLRRQLAERDRRLQEQSREIRRLNQRHQDAAKRLDDLIAELDRLDEQLAAEAATTV